MKQLLCMVLALLLLCGCAFSPVLREGYYLLPLEDSEGVPFYFCLEAEGAGYLHAMGQNIPVTWDKTGLGDLFADCVPTKEGMEFPDGDVTRSLRYSRTLPEGYANIVLRPGFYVPEDETLESLLTYAELREDGTGVFCIMGMEEEIEWKPEAFFFGDMTIYATADGFVAEDSAPMAFTYTGDALPDGYLPDPPAPGVYAISSIGYEGNMEIFGALSDENNCLELRSDGTGELRFRGSAYPLTWERNTASFETFSMMLMDLGVTTPGDPALVMGYITAGECPIEADSIAFRLLEGE